MTEPPRSYPQPPSHPELGKAPSQESASMDNSPPEGDCIMLNHALHTEEHWLVLK